MMDRKTRAEIIAIAVLISIFVLVFAGNMMKIMSRKSGGAGKPASTEMPAPAAASQGIEPLFRPKAEEQKAQAPEGGLQWGRDPFVLPEAGGGGADSIAGLRLMGITTSDKSKPAAIINNELYRIGSRIGKFTVKEILSSKVVVNDGEKDHDLKLSR